METNDNRVSPAETIQENTTDVEEDSSNTQCGFTDFCKPRWLQKCANPKVYLLVITVFGVVQGFAINGVNNVNTPVYERRYLLSSKSSSLVAAFYDISAGALGMFVGYFGASAHQPRLLAVGFLSMGLGTLLMATAHFASPPYNPGSSGQSLVCDINNDGVAGDSQAYLKNYIYFLLFGQVFNGFAGACLYNVGLTFLDQSCTTKIAALFIGIFTSGTVLGPAIGFLVGGSFLDIYVDYPSSPPEGLTVEDPAWVGAWWLPFVLSAILSFVLAFFMFLFPREFPGTAAIQDAKVSQAHDNGTEAKVSHLSGFGIGWRDIPKATYYLLKNPVYMFVSIENALEFCLIIGISTFLPKIISNQFSQSLNWSSILTGILAVPSAAVAQLLGGVVIKRFNFNLGQVLKLALATSVMALLLSPVYLARCSDAPVAGVVLKYPGSPADTDLSLDSTCNSGCGCTTSVYDPVCADGIQYFSPCHAGCSHEAAELNNGDKVYHNCTCLSGLSSLNISITAENKICDMNCKLFYAVFAPFTFLQIFFTIFAGTPLTIAILRVTPDKLRNYGLAVSWVLVRYLGTVPGPIVFGAIIDASCKVWQNDDAGSRGACWIYDNAGMAYRIVILCVVVKILSLGCNLLAIKLYNPPSSTIEEVTNN